MELVLKYFPDITEKQKEQFGRLQDLYTEWNDKVNVISRKDLENLFERHVLHSQAIAKIVTFEKGDHVLDVGTGGGFPGIPLAIMFPEAQFHLVDSIGKKIKVVENIANALGLQNVKAEQIRAEKVPDKTYDFVVSRAVTRIDVLFRWVQNKLKKESKGEFNNGLLCLKGGDLTEEFAKFKRFYRFYEINEFFEESFFSTKKVVYVPV